MKSEEHTICLTFDFDAICLWLGSFGAETPSMCSRGEFAVPGLMRVLKLLEKHDVPSTFFVPGHSAHLYPSYVKEIVDKGHEIGHHGWSHRNPTKLSREEERRDFELGFEALDWAAGVTPTGCRTAAWDFSPNTLDLMIEYDLDYSSTFMANDFYPYYLRSGDEFPKNEPFVFGDLVDVVELPPSWGLDDFPPLEYVWGMNQGPNTPSQVRELWQGEFDYMVENCPGGMYVLTCHPQFIGRGSRLKMMDELIEHMKGDGRVFSTLGDLAAKFR
ncbi:MAG: polysaccharide deacetylase, partial [bacterium]|nr:polysaccharide deacetylase [bacterium]